MARKIIQQKKTENIQNKNGHSVLTHGHINVSDGFNIDNVLHHIKHYLPSQTPLKDFIHHNSLHAFQDKLFYEGIFTAATIFGYQVTLELKDYRQLYSEGRIRKDVVKEIVEKRKGVISADFWKSCMLEKKYDCHLAPRIGWLRSHWNTRLNFDIDNKVQPLLFRILSSYLDQGIAIQKFPLNEKGFLASIRDLQKNSGEGFFKTKRAKDLLLNKDIGVYELLMILVGNESAFEHYLFDQQFSHRGWSGMVATLEAKPDSLLDKRRISLYDVVVLELLLEIDALDFYFKNRWNPLTIGLPINSYNLFAPVQKGEVMEVLSLWQDAFEWSYYDDVLSGLSKGNLIKPTDPVDTSFQAMFCIDERECSLRRHIESIDPKCETFGSPGFFGVEFFFKPEHGKFTDKLCPAPVQPAYLIKEINTSKHLEKDILFDKQSYHPGKGWLYSLGIGFWAGITLVKNLFFPKMSPAISNAFGHMDANGSLTIDSNDKMILEDSLRVGFTTEDMANRVEKLLRSIGLVSEFAPLVYAVAHGSSSANNPHHGAHDCGACSGRPGSINARVFAAMANNEKVRSLLNERGIKIPDSTFFVGGMHDTASDMIEFSDVAYIPELLKDLHKSNVIKFEQALNKNAKERSRRFASINSKDVLGNIRKAINNRSVSFFEPRPELGHGTNSVCIVGRRDISKHLFLDRRAFLNSYDYRTDPEGKILVDVLKPIGPVCGGINLEYYFSRVDNHKLGAGTKLPHNVVGLIGVSNGCDGDLRPGLPVQMIEVHDPVRLLVVVEHRPEIVLQCIQSNSAMYEWFINEWVHLIAFDPIEKKFFLFKNGEFTEYIPLRDHLGILENSELLFENASLMDSAHIADATKENLPVFVLN